MRTMIIPIGNSRGIRIPKTLLEESGLQKEVELKAKKGEIRITSSKKLKVSITSALLSEKVLAADWNKPEEDKEWKDLK